MSAVRIRRTSWLALAGVVTCILAGCGTTGTTSTFTLALDPGTPVTGQAGIRVAPATMEADAPRLYVVSVREWGRFDATDLANIEHSLVATLARHSAGGGPYAGQAAVTAPIEIHVRVRRYLVGVSNTGGGVLACVNWAAVKPAGEIAFAEQFYAADFVAYVGTVGGIKDSVHRAIVRRIATTALYLTAEPAAATALPTAYAGTYESLEDAIASLPAVLRSLGNPGAMATPNPVEAVAGAFETRGAAAIPWQAARPREDFDWAAYLSSTARGVR